jgi:hypothetical protein
MMKTFLQLLALGGLFGLTVGCEKTLEQERQDVRQEAQEAREEIADEQEDVQKERAEGAEEIRDEQRDVEEKAP